MTYVIRLADQTAAVDQVLIAIPITVETTNKSKPDHVTSNPTVRLASLQTGV